jgi:hypothetical protein
MRYTRPADRNRRKAERYPVHANVRVLCADSMIGVAARIVNISDSGAALELRVPLKLGEVVYLEVRQFHLYGTAHVNRCTSKFRGYVAGLEFQGSLVAAGIK